MQRMKFHHSLSCLLILVIAVAIVAVPASAAAPVAATEITLRHALQGTARQTLESLVVRFNGEHQGRARVALEHLQALTEPRQLPQLALLDADDALAFFQTLPRFRPLHLAMSEAGEKFEARQFLAPLADAVDDPAGRLQALPLGLAVPVLFWNKEAFVKAGLNPDQAPRTWRQLQDLAAALFDAGQRCPLTSSRFAWVHVENLSAQHGEPLAVRDARGVMRVVLNRMVDVKHLSLLASWQKSRYFHYFGRADDADRKFVAGECAMLTGASSLLATAQAAGFSVGVAALPHYDDVYGATPDNLLPDGAALWLLAGNKKAEDKVAAQFASFMLRPAVQREWVKATGFLPMTAAALDAASDAPALRHMLAHKERNLRNAGNARSKHGYGLAQQRNILGEEIETVLRGDRAPMEALNAAMQRINDGKP